MGYKDIPSGNIRDCLYADTDYTEWYVDKYGDLRADATHHDGTNHYLYRVFKDGVSETQMPVGSKMLYTGEMQAFPYLFRPMEPVSRLLELYMKSPFSVFLYSLFTVSVTKALRS